VAWPKVRASVGFGRVVEANQALRREGIETPTPVDFLRALGLGYHGQPA
jgi:hypothetical protein